MKNILLVEDIEEVQILVQSILGSDFNITVASDVDSALQAAETINFDLFLIDVVLPTENGFHLCARLRSNAKTKMTPVIFLTSKSSIQDKIMGFSLGGDDYIVKPFDPMELKIRVQSKLKNTNVYLETENLRKGSIKLNIPSQKAFLLKQNEEIELGLSPNEFKLLSYFLKHEGQVLTRSRLLDEIWGKKLNVTDRTVDTHIYQLRKKLQDQSQSIESVFGEGYRFSVVRESL